MDVLECPCCDRAFADPEALERHLDSAHQETLARWGAGGYDGA